MTSPVSYGALRCFVEVGRQGSIKRAAEALHVTPGAVSQQIAALEARFELRLLNRGHRAVTLSSHGERLLAAIAPGFAGIDAAVRLLEDSRAGPKALVVSTTPSFAACWLAPRLGRFAAQHPGIELRIETSVGLADLGGTSVDVAIRHGGGAYAGLDATLLARPRLIAIGPVSLPIDRPLERPADCLLHPLLQDRDRADWTTWLAAQGVRPGRVATKGLCYPDDALLIQGVMAGQGLAVVRDVYAAAALEAGAVRLVMQARIPTAAAYFVVVQPERMSVPKIAVFRDWLIREAGRAGAACVVPGAMPSAE